VSRTWDLIVYGATGFTGGQAARYLAAHAPPGLRWALGGRSKDKLDALAATLPGRPGVVVADGQDEAALAALAASTRVILTTAGPFAVHGDKLAAAAVAHRTDYVDITGETPWVASLIARFHERAQADGTRIVPFCGFDSIPSDLGAWSLVQHVRAAHGVGVRSITASFSMRGGVNGGTMASALNMGETGQSRQIGDPRLLQPKDTARVAAPDRKTVTWDAARGRWLMPFFMAPINSRVVGRSATIWAAAGQPYGEGFTYHEAMETRSRVGAWAMTLGMGAADQLLRTPAGRRVVAAVVPAPGQGPSEAAMDGGFFRARLTAEREDGGQSWLVLGDQGDPGNRATVKMLCESALTLLGDRDALPPHAGVLTPATALGAPLLDRLIRAGMRWDFGEGELPA
jgi:short subunit dehydrogenase-like uncharacterized protein